MKCIFRSRTAVAACALSLLSFLIAGPALAANCTKNPTHPSCPGSGGGGDGGGDGGGGVEIPPGKPAILFSAVTGGGAGNSIWGMDEGGTPVELVAAAKGVAHSWPVWSPDGTRFVYASRGVAKPGLYLFDAKTKTSNFLAEGYIISTPSWSPDGKWIAYSARERGFTDFGPMDLWFVRTDVPNPIPIDIPTAGWWENGIAWSSTGRLAVTRFSGEANANDTDLNVYENVVIFENNASVTLGQEEKINEVSAGAHFGLTKTHMSSPKWSVASDRLLVMGQHIVVLDSGTCDYAKKTASTRPEPTNCTWRQNVLDFTEAAWSCPRTGSERAEYVIYAFPSGYTKTPQDLHEIAADLKSPPIPWQTGTRPRHPSWWCPKLQ
jgi:hypothetical protein